MIIYFLGDIGMYNDNLKELLINIKSKINNEDIMVLLGDNFYDCGVESKNDKKWDKFLEFFTFNNTIYSILGNHDYQSNPIAQIQYKKNNWTMPNFYYYLGFNNDTQIWFLDTCQLVTMGYCEEDNYHGHVTKNKLKRKLNENFENLKKTQLKWLDESLKNSPCKNKIVVGHYPIITNGYHKGKDTDDLYELLIPIFKKYKIMLYISGHDHNSQYNTELMEDYTFRQLIIGNSSKLSDDFESNNFFYNKSCCYASLNLNNFDLRIEDKNEIIKIIKFI